MCLSICKQCPKQINNRKIEITKQKTQIKKLILVSEYLQEEVPKQIKITNQHK